MLHLPEIWDLLRRRLPDDRWAHLSDVYELVKASVDLDAEDLEPQAPGSDVPKWMRNVRNVLQYRKTTGEVEWDPDRHRYRLVRGAGR